MFCSGSLLVEVAEDRAGDVLPAGLLVVHDARRGREHDVAERTRRKHLRDPLLDVDEGHAEAGRDDTALVDAAVQLDDDLVRAVVIDDVEVLNVAWC